jgi:hypothetical protein
LQLRQVEYPVSATNIAHTFIERMVTTMPIDVCRRLKSPSRFPLRSLIDGASSFGGVL